MKNYLYASVAACILCAATMPAHAQSNYNNVKGDTNTTSDMRYMNDQRPLEQTSSIERTETVNTIEPAAGRPDSDFDDFTGFYFGGDVGYGIGTADVGGLATSTDVGLDGANGSLLLGYGFEHNFSWLGGYAGIELAYEFSGQDGEAGGVDFEKDHAWNISFRPGLTMWQDTLGYAILGYSRAEYNGAGDDEDFNGFIAGAGAEFDTNTAFKTRIEYTYTNYGEEDLGATSFEPQENNVKLGFLFRF
ncbi:MAG: outer membrane beta-barrel protein [Alphaproteobacteria bacterium]|nr:outer membrane beta-barrel protein [Alphaproteobacteria bacterium]